MVIDIYVLSLRYFLFFWRYASFRANECPWSIVKLLLLLICTLDSLLAYLYLTLLVIVSGRRNRRFVK